jgi:hypothetical protein
MVSDIVLRGMYILFFLTLGQFVTTIIAIQIKVSADSIYCAFDMEYSKHLID